MMAGNNSPQPPRSIQSSWTPIRISTLAKMDIARMLNPHSNADWRVFAAYLGFEDLTIQNFEERAGNSPNFNATLRVLRDWEQGFDGSPPVEILLENLGLMGRSDVQGVIRNMLQAGEFYDHPRTPPPPPTSTHPSRSGPSSGNPSGGASPMLTAQPDFPPPPAIKHDSDMFTSDLTKGSARIPTEDSYSSLSSMDLPPNEPEPVCNPPDVRPKEFQYNNYDLAARPQGVPPIPPNFEHNVIPQQEGANRERRSPPLTDRGTPTRSPGMNSGARPKTNQGELKRPPLTDSAQLKRTHSCENTSSSLSSSSSSSSSASSQNSNPWPGGKENSMMRMNGNPHRHREPEPNQELQNERRPGDYSSGGGYSDQFHDNFHSWPGQQRTDPMWPSDHQQQSSRQVSTDSLDHRVTHGVSPAPQQCKSGIGYGITFAWKDWRCGMELAKKLKRQGHHVEIDRKRNWYQNEAERDSILTNVFNSVTYIIIIYTPHYVREATQDGVESPINSRFLYRYMEDEFNRNSKKNNRFIPIVDASRTQCREKMFKTYPEEQHRYIVQLIRQQVPRQQGVVVERQISIN